MGWTRRRTRPSPCMTSAAVRSIFRFLEVGEGVIEVKSTNGDTHLGGDNIDQRIVGWLIAEFQKDEGLDLRSKGNEMALQRLRDAAERAKIELSTTMETEINLPFITADASRPEAPGEEADARQTGRDGSRHYRPVDQVRASRRSRMRASTPARLMKSCWSADRRVCRRSRRW